MYDRDHARGIIANIMSYNPHLCMAIRADGMLAVSKSKLADEQRFLMNAHRDEIVWYLSTPPEIVGICRRGHPVKWRCTEGGTWICACFFEVYVPQKPSRYPDLRDYWESGRAVH